ncbi:glycosyltransferase [Natribacillus halophilus]|uniref:Glycosyl transferase family 2 n=1 Tax=Natribacillus halophilus TaxID=549003 RepID=A0A1G8P1Q3_9BACI|nr:glycosyltransferase [Natribacillus halophilus]SDI86443.1 Glycosyl transferase family 2 [Natribacillus halophilus]
MISIGMATMPSRFKNLAITIPTLLNQCDRMYVHVNGATDAPSFLKKESKIKLTFSHKNKGGQMAFKGFPKTSGYYFCVDDDLMYPDDYVEKMVALMIDYDDEIIACVHGSDFDPYKPSKNVFKNKTNAHVSYQGLDDHARVMIPGVGTSAMSTKKFSLSPTDFYPHKNMRDAVVACKAAKAGMPVMAIKREANWIKKIPMPTEINKNEAYYENIDRLIARHIEYFKRIAGG